MPGRAPQGDFAARARYGLAAASFAKEDYSGASTAIGQLLAGNPEPALAARARYLRGLIFQREKQLGSAATDLEAFLNSQPPADAAADARYALTLCRIAAKQFDQAAATLATLVQQKPDYPNADRAYYELGHASLQENRTDGATAAFRTLAEKFPASPLAAEACFHVGRAHEEKADRAANPAEKTAEIAAAADAYTAALAKAKDAELREKLDYKLADMRFRQKQFEQAATILQTQLRDYPGGSLAGPARFLAAECLFAQNKFDEALPLVHQGGRREGREVPGPGDLSCRHLRDEPEEMAGEPETLRDPDAGLPAASSSFRTPATAWPSRCKTRASWRRPAASTRRWSRRPRRRRRPRPASCWARSPSASENTRTPSSNT